MPRGLNLASRPFVNTRPATAAAVVLGLVVLGLTVVSLGTVRGYLEGSQKTRAAAKALAEEAAALDARRVATEAEVARLDLATLAQSASDASWIARRRAFSWTRFLTRLERTLPRDVRVATIALEKPKSDAEAKRAVEATAGIPLQLTLVARDPDALPNVIQAFYESEWFDVPTPHAERGPEVGSPEGTELTLGVTYLDGGKGKR